MVNRGRKGFSGLGMGRKRVFAVGCTELCG